MARNRVDARAKRMYDYLLIRLNQPVRRIELFKALNLPDNTTNRAAIKRVRVLAEADGLCSPVPCEANGYTIGVTDDPVAALDPALWLSRVEQGIAVTKKVHQDFMKSRMSQMDKDSRAVTTAWLEFEEQVRAVNAGAANLTKAMVSMRREHRGDK